MIVCPNCGFSNYKSPAYEITDYTPNSVYTNGVIRKEDYSLICSECLHALIIRITINGIDWINQTTDVILGELV